MYGVGFGYGSAGATTILKGGGASYSYLLDTYSGSSVAYSLRKLSSTYSGSCIRVRRSSDNTEQNIGFVANVLDTASLLSFVGSGNGFVTTWYDQSGNGKNSTQSTASSQPQIVSSGSLIVDSSKVAINFDNFKPMISTPITYSSAFTVAHVTTQTTVNYLLGSATSGVIYNGSLYGAGANFGAFDGTNFRAITGGNLNRNLGYFNMTSSKLYVALNGSTASDTGSFASSLTLSDNSIHGLGGRDVGTDGLFFKGKIQEVILFSAEQSTNKTNIESNINTYYGIY